MTIERVALPPFGVEVPASAGMLKTHSPDKCFNDKACVIHNPSDHHMRDWPITLRIDRFAALAERVCPDGIGHPDPDSMAYITSLIGEKKAYYESIHGCDGCCRE